MAENLKQFVDIHANKTALVMGLGNSLMRYFHEFSLKRALNTEDEYFTVGVNDIQRCFTVDYMVLVDDLTYIQPDRVAWILASKARRIFTVNPLPGLVNQVPLVLGKRGVLDFSGFTMPYSCTSVYCACILAFLMGSRRIGVIGLDLTDGRASGDTGAHNLVESGHLPMIQQHFRELRDEFARRGCDFYNCNPDSLVQFNYLPLADL